MYIRFVIREIHPVSKRETGVFQAAYRLKENGDLPEYEESRLTELLEWFNTNLKEPPKFTSSKPPYYRKENKSISWFKDSAAEHISKLREVLSILDNHEIHFEMIKTERPGYIVYEDNHQVVAEPFFD
jgi:hypothetical protein